MGEVGRRVLLECAEHVVGLKGRRHEEIKQNGETALLDRLRTGSKLTKRDSKKLLSLRISAITDKHGEVPVAEIRRKAVFLFLTNKQCFRHNLLCLSEICGPGNPAVVLCTRSCGPVDGTAVASMPESGYVLRNQTTQISMTRSTIGYTLSMVK